MSGRYVEVGTGGGVVRFEIPDDWAMGFGMSHTGGIEFKAEPVAQPQQKSGGWAEILGAALGAGKPSADEHRARCVEERHAAAQQSVEPEPNDEAQPVVEPHPNPETPSIAESRKDTP